MVTTPSDLGTVVTSLPELTARMQTDISNIKEKPIIWLCDCAILTPKNDKASAINNILLKAFEGQTVNYKSFYCL